MHPMTLLPRFPRLRTWSTAAVPHWLSHPSTVSPSPQFLRAQRAQAFLLSLTTVWSWTPMRFPTMLLSITTWLVQSRVSTSLTHLILTMRMVLSTWRSQAVHLMITTQSSSIRALSMCCSLTWTLARS